MRFSRFCYEQLDVTATLQTFGRRQPVRFSAGLLAILSVFREFSRSVSLAGASRASTFK
jgi:hypothetical protein